MIADLLRDWHPSKTSQPYWDGIAAGRLLLQRCGSCGMFQHPPRAVCLDCAAAVYLTWTDASGLGVVYSFTVVERALLPALRDVVPYVLAIVALDEGPHLVSWIVPDDGQPVAIGDRVTVAFEAAGGKAVFPVFTTAPADGTD